MRSGFRPLAPGASVVRAPVVDEPARRDPHEPCPGVVRHTVAGPLRRRGEQRLLDGVLGAVEVAVAAHEGAEHLGRQTPPQLLTLHPAIIAG